MSEPFDANEVARFVNPSKLRAYEGATGTLEGSVFIDGDACARRLTNDIQELPGGAAHAREALPHRSSERRWQNARWSAPSSP